MTIDPVVVWVAIALLSVGTYGLRVVFLLGVERVDDIPPMVERTLEFLPIAVLVALVSPYLVYVEGAFALSITNEQLIAGIVGIVVAWRTENMVLTIVAGMAVLWTLQWLL